MGEIDRLECRFCFQELWVYQINSGQYGRSEFSVLAAARGSRNTVAYTGNGCKGLVMNSLVFIPIRNAYRAVRSRVAAFYRDRNGSIAVMTARRSQPSLA